MKKNLKIQSSTIYHFVDGNKVDGPNPRLMGDCSGLMGNCSGIIGDIDSCEPTKEDRKRGVDIRDLVEEEEREMS